MMKFIVGVILIFSMSLPSNATPDISQFHARVAPTNVLSQMKNDGHSVYFQQINIGPGQGQMFCHIYTVDKDYFLDLFRPAIEDKFKRLNSVDLGKTPHSTQLNISFMWLQPKHYSGPILRLCDQDFPGKWDASDTLIVFPDGFYGRAVQQNFLTKIIGGTAINPSFDSYDERGLLVVNLWDVYEGQGSRVCLFWNSQGFVERKPRYAIVSPLFKTHTQVRNYVNQPNIENSDYIVKNPMVHPSRYYQARGLEPGYLVIVFWLLDLQPWAEKVVNVMHEDGIPCTILRLY